MNLLDVFNLGSDTQYVKLAKSWFSGEGPPVKKENYILHGIKDTYRFLKDEKLAVDMHNEIAQLITRLEKDYPEEDKKIEEDDATVLNDAFIRLRKKISEELKNVHILTVEMQSGLNPNELRKVADKSPSEFISEQTWKKLTDIEKSDFSDAAICLLLGTATPSAMVALRGAEASIRNYYRCKTKSEPGDKTWRQLTKELKSEAPVLGIEDTFVGYLDYIGDAKRNFAQHPNKIYSLREAVIIFMQIVGLVEDIYAQI